MATSSQLLRLLRPGLNRAQLLQAGPAQSFHTCASAFAAEPARADPEPDFELPHDLPFPAPPKRDFIPLNFNDPRAAFAPKSTFRLLRNWAILSTCQFKPLVNNADTLLKLSQKVLGSTITNGVVKHTFFQHFCAGATQKEVKETMEQLAKSGIGGILDYAAEEDVESDDGASSRSTASSSVVARTYDYATEEHCDNTKNIFLHSIQTAANTPGQGFAAIKVTGLGNPHLLERVSNTLNQMRSLFKAFDQDSDGYITKEEFAKHYRETFSDGSDERLAELYDQLDTNHTGHVDFLSWSEKVSIQEIPRLVARCRESGPLSQSALSDEELQLFDAMLGRMFECAEAAAQSGVKLMVDAEHTFFQPAIDHAARELCRKHNRDHPIIFNTYQCYLKNSHRRAVWDMERAKRQGWKFGAKLVRGAYLDLETARAHDRGYEVPIWKDIQHTHANYNRVVDEAITRVKTEGAEVMVASHNQGSMEHAVALMHELELDPPTCGVYFGQLLGMSDTLTYVLGGNGYRAYKDLPSLCYVLGHDQGARKWLGQAVHHVNQSIVGHAVSVGLPRYVPFGPVAEVMPYLVRRAQENSAVLGIVPQEKAMIMAELRRRVFRQS